MKIKLPNGNVTNRVLPVRIYDLDNADIKLCETVLGGVLRGVEFIYAEPGVNRPLKPDDDEKINLNKTKYRNQINKVGNAIKEIISGLKGEPTLTSNEKTPIAKEPMVEVHKVKGIELQDKPAKLKKRKLLSGVVIVGILLLIALFTYPKIFKTNTLERFRMYGKRISVAVMPFQNLTNDTTRNYWQVMIQDILITQLSNLGAELEVKQSESINSYIKGKGFTNYASITRSVANTISKKLDANVFISGSIIQEVGTIRLTAQLVDSKTEEPFKSFQIDGAPDHILQIIDSLSGQVKDFLVISKWVKEDSPDDQIFKASTNSPEAFKYRVLGDQAFSDGDYKTALDMFYKAIAIDSNYTWAAMSICFTCYQLDLYDEGKIWEYKVYKKKDLLSRPLKMHAYVVHAIYYETAYEIIKYYKQLLEYDQVLYAYLNIGICYNYLNQLDKAIPELEKALEIFKKWKMKIYWIDFYTNLGYSYHKTGQYKKEKKLYKKAQQDYPNDYALLYRQAILAFTEGDTIAANQYINRYISVRKEKATSEATIKTSLAGLYMEAGILDKAEDYYRQALSLEPKNPIRLSNLSRFLTNSDRNIGEGSELADSVLKISPNNYIFLAVKGLALYKQGKYNEALRLYEKSDSSRQWYLFWIYQGYEDVKKAVANQKNN